MNTIEIDKIIISKEDNMYVDDEQPIENLIESIKINGVLEPVIVRKQKGVLYLIDGKRRVEACKKLGIIEIPYKYCRQRKQDAAKLITAVQKK